MPIFTSLLFLFLALALWPLVTRNSGQRELRRRKAEAEDRLETAARICVAAARDSFGISLDHSLSSIDWLDEMIDKGWSDAIETSEVQNDASFVMGAYLGDVFVRHHLAEWQWKDGKTVLYFPISRKIVSPFELIEKKINNPMRIGLARETAQWQSPDNSEINNASSAE